MGIFDALTGNAGHAAAADQRNVLAALIPNLASTGQDAYRNAGQYLQGGFDTAGNALGTGFDTARTDLGAGFGSARTDLGTGYGASTGAINTGAGNALGYLQGGTQGALGQLGQARTDLTAGGGAYAPLSALAQQYGQGAGLYADALGINGGAGNQRATDAFHTGPGYQFALNQGVDAITRAANASGGLGGNSLRDTIKFGQGLADQNYQQWLSNLSPYNNLQLSATQGAASGNQANNTALAGVDTAGANLLNSSGIAQAGVATGQGNNLADLARQYYGSLGNLSTGQGSAFGALDTGRGGALAQLATGQGSALANNQIGGAQNWQSIFGSAIPQWNNTIQQDAAVSNAASKNVLDLGQQLAKLAVGSFAGPSSGSMSGNAGDLSGLSGNNGSSLSNLFSGNFFPVM